MFVVPKNEIACFLRKGSGISILRAPKQKLLVLAYREAPKLQSDLLGDRKENNFMSRKLKNRSACLSSAIKR